MKTVGLWIDLQKAIIVSDTERGVDIAFVNSDIDHRQWQYDVWELSAELRQRMSNDQMGRFYGSISGSILDSRSIFIFGPGEAKRELTKQLQSDFYGGTILDVESAGLMTNSQIVERVRTRFAEPVSLAGQKL